MSDAAKWNQDIEVLLDADKIRQRVRELGQEITAAYRGDALCVVGILKGSFIFMADLVRSIELPLTCEFIGISSYSDATKSSGVVKLTNDLTRSITGDNVLLVEDIVDTGLSMKYLLENLSTRKPRSLKVCTLLDKPENRKVDVAVDFVGFEIPNHFVVGFGLDVAGRFRNVPHIGIYHGG